MKKILKLTLLGCCLLQFGCATGQKTDESLISHSTVITSPVKPQYAPLPEVTLDVYAYPKAIAAQEDIIFREGEGPFKRKAYLLLVALHMSRENPNQNFLEAGISLDKAVELDPSLLDSVVIQRWVDIFAKVSDLHDQNVSTERLQKENDILQNLVQEQKCTIVYLEKTLEELKKVEIDVEKKRRLYR